MNILGINYFFHDSSACLVVDGKLVAAVEEERLNRQKHTTAFPERAIARCLSPAGLDFADVDHVAVSIQPTKDWSAKTLYGITHLSRSRHFINHELVGGYFRQKSFWQWYRTQPHGSRHPTVHFVPHHMSHAAGSFLVSPFEYAALLSLDGSGEWATAFIGEGEGTRISCFNESYFPHSLIVRVREDGRLWVDLSYFNYQYLGRRRCGPKFYQTFGSPRRRGEDFAEHHQHVAAAFQHALEERALDLCRHLRAQSRTISGDCRRCRA
jgi:carbamoyltransferase